ncbi:hypothetical protein niasHT_017965 [Heterodera trifolii]|uniref:Uncharacterized protein n=1 Tax=Heterodera trifolii TaxID=157864 RepID=A0ABD2LBI7_9BILA
MALNSNLNFRFYILWVEGRLLGETEPVEGSVLWGNSQTAAAAVTTVCEKGEEENEAAAVRTVHNAGEEAVAGREAGAATATGG